MKVRNISDQALSVPCLGRIVEPDEVVEVTGEAEGYDWPASTWAEVAAPKKKSSSASADESEE